jgi:hypothetical protein
MVLHRKRAAQTVAGTGSGKRGSPWELWIRAWLRSVLAASWCVSMSSALGCSGQSSFVSGGATVGQLKTSLSHLEAQNQELKSSLAKAQRENRSIEDRLVQEQIDNGDLAARLDDARNLLRDRGIESDVRIGSHVGTDGPSAEDDASRPRTLRAGQRTRARRKPPFARITGSLDSIPSIDDGDGETRPHGRAISREREGGRARRSLDGELDHHAFYSDSLGWLPVGGGPRGSERLTR